MEKIFYKNLFRSNILNMIISIKKNNTFTSLNKNGNFSFLTIERNLKFLENKKIIYKNIEGRKKLIYFTDKGLKILKLLEEIIKEIEGEN